MTPSGRASAVPPQRKANPACITAKKAEAAAKTALARAEVALAKLPADPAIPARTKNGELNGPESLLLA